MIAYQVNHLNMINESLLELLAADLTFNGWIICVLGDNVTLQVVFRCKCWIAEVALVEFGGVRVLTIHVKFQCLICWKHSITFTAFQICALHCLTVFDVSIQIPFQILNANIRLLDNNFDWTTTSKFDFEIVCKRCDKFSSDCSACICIQI